MKAVISGLVLAGSAAACSAPREPVTLDIDLGEGPAGRCVIIYELQQRARFGLATYWPVHVEESGDARIVRVSKSLCPDLMIETPGRFAELLKHDGGKATVDLTGAQGYGRCDAMEPSSRRDLLEEQLATAGTARCAGW